MRRASIQYDETVLVVPEKVTIRPNETSRIVFRQP
jgi:hypothetical protein